MSDDNALSLKIVVKILCSFLGNLSALGIILQ